MRVRDVMTRNVICIGPEDTILKAARIMLAKRISGLPVIDDRGGLVGMVTEGDFLQRSEIDTERRRPRWLEFMVGPGKLADEYAHASGRKVKEIMTKDPVTVGEDVSLGTVVELMERRQIKRLPVLRDSRVVGIISRANLVHALVSVALETEAIRRSAIAFLQRLPRSPGRRLSMLLSVTVWWSCGVQSRTSGKGTLASLP